jgi:hypothetical protein
MEWNQFLGLGFIAALVTAGSNWFSTWFFSNRQQQQSADYDGVRLAIALERFSYECACLISDEGTWYASRGSHGALFSEIPPLEFPPETVWKGLDLDLVDRFLTFSNDLLRSNSVIRGEAVHLIPAIESADEPREQAGLMGYRAYILAGDFRTKYSKIAAPSKLHPWDYIALLKETHDEKMVSYNISRLPGS